MVGCLAFNTVTFVLCELHTFLDFWMDKVSQNGLWEAYLPLLAVHFFTGIGEDSDIAVSMSVLGYYN